MELQCFFEGLLVPEFRWPPPARGHPPSPTCPPRQLPQPGFLWPSPKPALNFFDFPYGFRFGTAPLKKKNPFRFPLDRPAPPPSRTLGGWRPSRGGVGAAAVPRRRGAVRSAGPHCRVWAQLELLAVCLSTLASRPAGAPSPPKVRRTEVRPGSPGKQRWSRGHGGGRGAARARRAGRSPRRGRPPHPGPPRPGPPRSLGARSSGSSPAPRGSAARCSEELRRRARCAARAGAWRCWSAAGPASRCTSCRRAATAPRSRVSAAGPRPPGPSHLGLGVRGSVWGRGAARARADADPSFSPEWPELWVCGPSLNEKEAPKEGDLAPSRSAMAAKRAGPGWVFAFR